MEDVKLPPPTVNDLRRFPDRSGERVRHFVLHFLLLVLQCGERCLHPIQRPSVRILRLALIVLHRRFDGTVPGELLQLRSLRTTGN